MKIFITIYTLRQRDQIHDGNLAVRLVGQKNLYLRNRLLDFRF